MSTAESIGLSHKRVSRIIWAFDPFETDIQVDLATTRDIGRWAKASDIAVEPIFVFTPVSGIEQLATDKIEVKMQEMVAQYEIPVGPPRVLLNPAFSVSEAAQCLLDHAEKSGAGLILVSSHGRRGFPKMLFGSFAETLLNMSTLPLLFLNHRSRPERADFQRVLWATDFSEACKRAFESFLFQANGICKEIVLYHDVSLTFDLASYLSRWEISFPSSDELYRNHRDWARSRAELWLERAGQFGFEGKVYLDSGLGDVATEILAAAKSSLSGLVVMASQRGPFSSMILGSESRKLVRASEMPVWIYGVHYCELAEVKERELSEPPLSPFRESVSFPNISLV